MATAKKTKVALEVLFARSLRPARPPAHYCFGNEPSRFTWKGGIDDAAVIGGFIETALPFVSQYFVAGAIRRPSVL